MTDIAEMKKQLRQTMFMMHGGPVKFDCWLTITADNILTANTEVPPQMQQTLSQVMGWIQRPTEVLDYIIEQFERVNAWDYKVRTVNGAIQVVDELSSHIIEEVPNTSDNLQALEAKYQGQI